MIVRFVRRVMVWLIKIKARIPGVYHKNRIVIIAGSGDLPLQVARGAASQGLDVRIFALESPQRFEGFNTTCLSLEAPKQFSRAFFKVRAGSLCLIGAVTLTDEVRRLLYSVAQNYMNQDHIGSQTATSAYGRDCDTETGDSALSHLLVRFCDQMNITLRDPKDFLNNVWIKTQDLGATKSIDPHLVKICVNAAVQVGKLDIGQAVVGFGRRVVAVEGAEGTDGLLERVALMRNQSLFDRHTEGVLVKWAKPGQRQDIDLPTIGPQTVQNCARAGIGIIIVHQDHCFIAQQDQTHALAKQHGIMIKALPEESVGLL